MKKGDRVVVIRDDMGDRNGWCKIGMSGQIMHSDSGHGLGWDVRLDKPLPDGRKFLWFSTRELQVI